MVVAADRIERPVRDGEIVSVGPDGGPPYRVRWSDTGTETLFFPGPDAHVQHLEPGSDTGQPSAASTEPAGEAGQAYTKSWRVDIYLYEGPDSTSAQAVLHSDAPSDLKSQGVARRRPDERDVPEIGDEVAVARALSHLADLLRQTAEEDLGGVIGQPVTLKM
jgi:uncharacterized protein DUF1876/uncharacterized protein DUF1918